MLKDIPENKVTEVGMAVVPETGEGGEDVWNVYVVNMKNVPIETVLVSSKGYGHYEGKDVKTTTLRHGLNDIAPKSFALVEPIIKSVFGLNNEYWLSFYIGREVYDRRFLFLPESIKKEHLVNVPIMNKLGVLIV